MLDRAIALHTAPVLPLRPAPAPPQDREQLAVLNFLATYTGTTRTSYQESLKTFYEWCGQHGIRMLDVTRGQLELYLRHLESYVSARTGRPLAQATIANRFGAVANFLAYATSDELIEKNPAVNVRRPKVDREAQKRSYLDVGDFHIFVRAASREGGQVRALIMLMATIGMRVNEVCSLNVEDVHLDQGQAYLTYLRKGGRVTRPDLPTRTLLALQLLIDQRPASGPLFLTVRGTRIDRRYVQRVIDRLCESAGISKRITPHSLRRSFATTAARLGTSTSDLQRALYHADPRTSLLYVQIADGGSTTRHIVTDFLVAG